MKTEERIKLHRAAIALLDDIAILDEFTVHHQTALYSKGYNTEMITRNSELRKQWMDKYEAICKELQVDENEPVYQKWVQDGIEDAIRQEYGWNDTAHY